MYLKKKVSHTLLILKHQQQQAQLHYEKLETVLISHSYNGNYLAKKFNFAKIKRKK